MSERVQRTARAVAEPHEDLRRRYLAIRGYHTPLVLPAQFLVFSNKRIVICFQLFDAVLQPVNLLFARGYLLLALKQIFEENAIDEVFLTKMT